LVQSEIAKYDLDNILLDKLPDYESALEAVFSLKNLLFEGNVGDLTQSGNPPRGLELILGNVTDPQVEALDIAIGIFLR